MKVSIVIECTNCHNGEEMTVDEQRHHSQSFRHIHSFNTSTHSTAPEELNGLAVYECPCGTLVVSKFVQEADPENDEFECEACGDINDIDESVRIAKSVYLCTTCHDEIVRCDEKNGLYPEKWDDCN